MHVIGIDARCIKRRICKILTLILVFDPFQSLVVYSHKFIIGNIQRKRIVGNDGGPVFRHSLSRRVVEVDRLNLGGILVVRVRTVFELEVIEINIARRRRTCRT